MTESKDSDWKPQADPKSQAEAHTHITPEVYTLAVAADEEFALHRCLVSTAGCGGQSLKLVSRVPRNSMLACFRRPGGGLPGHTCQGHSGTRTEVFPHQGKATWIHKPFGQVQYKVISEPQGQGILSYFAFAVSTMSLQSHVKGSRET